MADSLVSWLMPVYNGEKFMRRAFDSMLNQTYQNFTIIIIIEFGCTDNTAEICEEYAARDKRVFIFYNRERLGVARSLNRGIGLCKGKYIARMDVDDISYPERLERQVEFMEAHPDVGVLGTGCRVVGHQGERTWEYPGDSEHIRARLLFELALTHPTVMLRTELFKKNNWKYPDCEAEDYALFSMLISQTLITCLPDILLDYHEHKGQATSTKFSAVREASINISRIAIDSELGVKTKNFGDAYFGWRYYDIPPYDVARFLLNNANLLKEIKSANDRLQKIDNSVLYEENSRQWGLTKYISRMTSFVADIPFEMIEAETIDASIHKIQNILSTNPKAILYGTGRYCNQIMNKVSFLDVVAFCDSDNEKHGTIFHGKRIVAPEQLTAIDYDYIFISSPIYAKEIRQHLVSQFNIESEKIFMPPALDELLFYHVREQYDKQYAHKGDNMKAYLFCAPDYGNLGDHAIAHAEHVFFTKRLGVELAEILCSDFKNAEIVARHHITPSDLILITGGGFLGSLWFSLEQQAREVIKAYPNNPIIILPQTLYWEDTPRWTKEREETQRVYAAHRDLTLCARDTETYGLMTATYPENRVLLVPDMVLCDTWDGYFDDNAKRNGALLCLKADKESILDDEGKIKLRSIAEKLCGQASLSNTNLDMEIPLHERDRLLRKKLNEFCNSKLVITDRLHGMIFAAITGTPCVVLNNCNHKLKATFEWIKNLTYIQFADSIDDVEALASAVLISGAGKYDISPLAPQFEGLAFLIQEQYICK